MSIKRTLLVVVAALAALALAAPAAAMAEEVFWTGGETEEAAFQFELTGKTKTTSSKTSSGFECEVHATVTANVGGKKSSTGTVHYQVTANTCVGSGTFKNCKVEAIDGTTGGLYSWTYHLFKTPPTGKREIVVTNAFVQYTVDKNCDEGKIPNNFVEVKFTELIWTPDNADAISSVTATGTGSLYVGGTEESTSASGELKVNAPNVKKYGLTK